jgi:hypothetical protein
VFGRREFRRRTTAARGRGTRLAPQDDYRARWNSRAGSRQVPRQGTTMTRGFKEGVGSAVCFVGVLAALVSVDPRVRDRFWELFSGAASGDVSPVTNRLSELGGAVIDAARHQSIENAPMLVFAAVGAVLVMFMLRT